ncbi:MAG TPA: ATP synthase F1 subunit epsilon [Candidatus Binatia bacterium]|nr:ATP synthase F1 subunit epsilon [Candidatus Binatia bacterium]
MILRVVTPTKTLVDSEVAEVTAPGVAGQIGVLPQHATFLGQLEAGVVAFTASGKRARIVISGGYAEVVDDVITILADDAEFAESIDVSAARAETDRLRERLSSTSGSQQDIDEVLKALRLAEIRSGQSS